MNAPQLVLFGCNALALEVAHGLAAVGVAFLLADRDEALVAQARAHGYAAVALDYTDDEALRGLGLGAGIARVFCLLPEDSENVFLAISARALDPQLRIATVCQSPEAAAKLYAAGADKVIDPYEISGARIHELIERPAVADLLERTVFGQADLNIAEVTVPAQAWVCQRRLAEVQRVMTPKVILLGLVDLERGPELVFAPRGAEHVLDAGDVLVVIGARRHIAEARVLIERPDAPAGA